MFDEVAAGERLDLIAVDRWLIAELEGLEALHEREAREAGAHGDVLRRLGRHLLGQQSIQEVGVSLADVDAGPDRVRLTWYTAGNPGLRANVYRRTTDTEWSAIGGITADGAGYLRFEDSAVRTGEHYGYRLGIIDGEAEVFAGEVWTRPELLAFGLEGARPNPTTARNLTVHFTLPTAIPARIELLDVTGRRIEVRDIGALGAGRHGVRFSEGRRLAPGLYLVRITQGGSSRTTRIAVVE